MDFRAAYDHGDSSFIGQNLYNSPTNAPGTACYNNYFALKLQIHDGELKSLGVFRKSYSVHFEQIIIG